MSAHAKDVRELGVGLLVAHPDNPRAAGPLDDLSGLRDSISAHGILSPLIVRPLGDSYQVVCGHRRLACAEELQISAVPCFVRELTDAEALEVQLVENLQRENLHPLEEAEALQRLLTAGSHTTESLAAAIGKSRGYVAGRLRLASLTEAAKDILRRDPGAVATALLVARIPDPKLQAKAVVEILEGITRWVNGKTVKLPMPAREAAELIREKYMLTLADAPFALDDEHLVPAAGACTRCPMRTGCSPDLFGDVDETNLCTNPTCYGLKVAAAWDQAAKVAQAQKHPMAKILPLGKATRAVEKFNGSFVRLTEKDDRDKERRTFRQIATAKAIEPQVYLARGEKGGVVPVYQRTEFDALVARKKTKKAAAEKAQEPSAPSPEDWRLKSEIRQRAMKAFATELWKKAIEFARQAPSEELLREYLQLSYDGDEGALEMLRERQILQPKEKLETALERLEMSDLWATAIVLLADGNRYAAEDFARRFGIGLSAITKAAEKEVLAELAAAKAPKVKPDTPAEAKKRGGSQKAKPAKRRGGAR